VTASIEARQPHPNHAAPHAGGTTETTLTTKAAAQSHIETTKADAATWRRGLVPDSRTPIMPPCIREKIEAIEADARAKGWPPELLWNSGFWDSPRGLAALLDEGDEIAEVAVDYIAILKTQRNILRFQRRTS
jgi:hypothetical protein